MNIDNKIKNIIRALYPTGRAWSSPSQSASHKDINVKSKIFTDLVNDIEAFVKSILPTQDIEEEDLKRWEEFLQVDYKADNLEIEQRINEVISILSYTNGYKYTQSLKFIEAQIRAAGFDIRIYRWGKAKPGDTELIANSINLETGFTVENNAYSFLIAGNSENEPATIDIKRRIEFIRKVLKHKPMDMVCYLLSNISIDNGKYECKYSNYVCSRIEDNLPVASNVRISGNLEIGAVLTGEYTYFDLENDQEINSYFDVEENVEAGTYKTWYISDDDSLENSKVLSRGDTIVVIGDFANKYITFGVRPANKWGYGIEQFTTLKISRQEFSDDFSDDFSN